MGEVLSVLVDIRGYVTECTGKKRKVPIGILASDLREFIFEEYSGEIEYFSEREPDDSPDSDELILGFEQTDKLLARVKGWNESIRSRAVYALEALEKANPVSGSLSSWVKTASFEELKKGCDWYILSRALKDMCNIFSFGCDKMVVTADKAGNLQYCHGPLIDTQTYAQVMVHPENFAIVDLIYH